MSRVTFEADREEIERRTGQSAESFAAAAVRDAIRYDPLTQSWGHIGRDDRIRIRAAEESIYGTTPEKEPRAELPPWPLATSPEAYVDKYRDRDPGSLSEAVRERLEIARTILDHERDVRAAEDTYDEGKD